jgi:hypothetical protein
MLIKLRYSKNLTFLIAVCTTLLFLINSLSYYLSAFDYTLRSNSLVILKSKCKCHSEIVTIKSTDGVHNIDIHNPRDSRNDYNYNITTKKFEELSLSCDLYKVLRRGSRQKVIAFSLYGKFFNFVFFYFFFVKISRTSVVT